MPENVEETINESSKNPIFDRTIQSYDQDIINSPEWLSVKAIEKILGMGDRTVRNKAKSGTWRKKYAVVDGSPMVYFSKEDVYSYLKTNNLIDKSGLEDAQTSIPTLESTSGKPNQNSVTDLTFLKALPQDAALTAENALSIHKEVLKELKDKNDKLINAEKTSVTWKTNTFWAIGLAVLCAVCAGLFGSLLWKSSKNTSELTQNYNNLSGKYEDAQDKLLQAKETLLEKDQLLMKTNKTTQVTNATGN